MENYNSSSVWTSRINNAIKHRQDWSTEFKCDLLEDYYEGKQWKGRKDFPIANYNPYVINLVYSTIKIKLATILFQKPSFTISPVATLQWDQDTAVKSAKLKEDVLNTIIKNPNIRFARHIKLAALESFFRFGLLEVGYAADWRNPQKDDPLLRSWTDKDVEDRNDRVLNNNEVPVNERFYVKRIMTKRFLVPDSDATDLEDHDWCGYSQFYYVSTLKKTPGIKFPKDWDSSVYSGDYVSMRDGDDKQATYLKDGKVCRCYHIFDVIAKKRRLLLDDGNFTELWSMDQERLPLIDIRWDYRLRGFYPIPPVFNWLSPQDEINESREQARSHRRRFTAKYEVDQSVSEESQEKFFSGPDGVGIPVPRIGCFKAIDPPSVSAANQSELVLSKEDFNIISGTSAEARPGGDRETATKSQIANQRAQIRENADQLDFSESICLVGREILCQAKEKLVGGLWVKYSSNPAEAVLTDVQLNAPVYQYVKGQDLSDGYDFSIEVDINNATPAAMAAQEQAYVKLVTMLTNFPMLAMSPILIRETAWRVGYKNETVIHQMQQVAILSMAAKANQAANAQGQTLQGAANAQETKAAQMETPDVAEIGNQLTQQIQ